LPPIAKAKVCVPAPAKRHLAVESPVGFDVQLVPFHSSVDDKRIPPGGVHPPNATAAV